MLALGIVGDTYFKQETQGTVSAGETLTLGGYSLHFEGLRDYPGSDGREVVEASTHLSKEGQLIRPLKPRRDYFVVQQQPVTVPGVHSTPGQDVYVLLVGWDDNGSMATFKIYINPLINWVWAGGLVMILGTLIAAWSSGDEQKEASYRLKLAIPSLLPTTGD
jgi:cytochrome c-type biogenesis protein CcmF